MHIPVLYSLPTKRAAAGGFLATDEDTKQSAEKVAACLVAKGAVAPLIPISEDTIPQVIDSLVGDLIFNLVEWTGLDLPLGVAAVEKLEARGIPFTGATSKNYAMTSDKVAMKLAFEETDLPTPRYQIFLTGAEPVRSDFRYPVIAKPSLEHCSIGLTKAAIAHDAREIPGIVARDLAQFEQAILVEEFIDGPEYHVTLYQKKEEVIMLPPAKIAFDTKGTDAFLTYNSRWTETDAEFTSSHVADNDTPPELMRELTRVCLATFRALGFRDYARFDIRTRGNDVFILETNSNPGLDDDPMYEMTVSFRLAGIHLADFVWNIVEQCLYRTSV